MAAVLNVDSNGLRVVRGLGGEGVPVIGIDHRRTEPGLQSPYCTSSLCENPTVNPEAAVTLLINRGKQLDTPAVLFPTCDVSERRESIWA